MKKILSLLASTLILILVTACSGGTPVEQQIKLINQAADEISNTQDEAKIQEIMNTLQKDISDIQEKNKDFEPTEAETQALEKAQMNLLQALFKSSILDAAGTASQMDNEPMAQPQEKLPDTPNEEDLKINP